MIVKNVKAKNIIFRDKNKRKRNRVLFLQLYQKIYWQELSVRKEWTKVEASLTRLRLWRSGRACKCLRVWDRCLTIAVMNTREHRFIWDVCLCTNPKKPRGDGIPFSSFKATSVL